MSKRHTAREIIAVLKTFGFTEKKNNGGAHRSFYNLKTGKKTVISVHNLGKEIPVGTETEIFRLAGIKKEDIHWK